MSVPACVHDKLDRLSQTLERINARLDAVEQHVQALLPTPANAAPLALTLRTAIDAAVGQILASHRATSVMPTERVHSFLRPPPSSSSSVHQPTTMLSYGDNHASSIEPDVEDASYQGLTMLADEGLKRVSNLTSSMALSQHNGWSIDEASTKDHHPIDLPDNVRSLHHTEVSNDDHLPCRHLWHWRFMNDKTLRPVGTKAINVINALCRQLPPSDRPGSSTDTATLDALYMEAFRRLMSASPRIMASQDAKTCSVGDVHDAIVVAATTSALPRDPRTRSFVWTNNTVHAAPEAWVLPSTPCKTMWHLWFWGDDAVGPYRHLQSSDVQHKCSKVVLCHTRSVMDALLHVACTMKLVPSVDDVTHLPHDSFTALFDTCFDHLLGKESPDGPPTARGFDKNKDYGAFTCSRLFQLMERAKRKRPRDEAPAGGQS
ncbi:Aste57867_12136 [Aphanomyces stellatus]|uniref:Aste57867_12136 protein n=1 Tax=Aphanomyces stellatus TaxID=120398 RepID=A0A485KVD2_9STRA|nr:hypothetical protein As57867_012091 [Aphanomyces stellatus]VFT88990.1 Aste57867_12136 [Aphanomyces stellatus]